MSKAEKSKRIVELLECIEDEVVLTQVMEDVAFYASKKDIADELNAEQLNDLDKAIEEANNNETISWNAFKSEMTEPSWKMQLIKERIDLDKRNPSATIQWKEVKTKYKAQ